MSLLFVSVILLTASYLIGAIPFGYLVGRWRGVNLFEAGSGNIGATNAARVLGARFGVLVFVLDLLKGMIPCAAIVPIARTLVPLPDGLPDLLRVGAAGLAFLGHLFPIYLGFRGGKGVATGAGTILVLVPGPALLAMMSWVVVLFASRTVSLASLAAVMVLVGARLIGTPSPFSPEALPVTCYLIAGTVLVVVKHWANIKRLLRGTENRIGDFTMRGTILRGLHILVLGFWFGGAGFFNFFTAPAIFDSFKRVVYAGPSDRTAQETIIPVDAPAERKDALASALAGSAVAPVFPILFTMEAVCGVFALVTALSWWSAEGKVHRWRVYLIALALVIVAVNWLLYFVVSDLRLLRFSTDPAVAAAAKLDFARWHLMSLLLSLITVCLAGVSLALAAWLPTDVRATVAGAKEEQKMIAS